MIEHDDIKLDTMFKISIAVDICKVMEFFVLLYHKFFIIFYAALSIDWDMIVLVLSKGLAYLHKSDLRFHGNLKSSNCLIDSRWVCKLTDFAPRHLQGEDIDDKEGEDEKYAGYKILLNLFTNAQPDKPLN